MRIAFFADLRTPNSWYRALGPLQALQRLGHEAVPAFDRRGALSLDPVLGCDVLLIHRASDRGILDAIAHAKQRGVGVIWDNDDDQTAVPKNNIAASAMRGMAGATFRRDLSKTLQAVDVVTTPSHGLAERFRELGASDVRVLENYVRDDLRPTNRWNGGRVVVGWLAGAEHHLDVSLLKISETCAALLDAHAAVEVVTIGARLQIDHPRYRNVRDIRFMDLDRHVAEFDVGIAPIADIPFNRCRSNVKLKEYAVLGVPWLASPVGPYLGLGEKQGGELVADGDWFEALSTSVGNSRRRKKLAKHAGKWGASQRIGRHVSKWESLFEEVRQRLAV
ncbi:hypothetical protein [Conexibacter arvalis]|uniref:Glycosyltransferase n=1 Tax=Conexibacter arvalis TaxID=912552 RepID=A0A840IGZ3_9ACTN|nr:hypothetical protein [Conexibacter arvalis]MBB4664327.1 hypothetical protein [Conexibacter arvalis]